MNKKDYIAIANVIRSTKNTYSANSNIDPNYVLNDLALALSEMMEKDNPRFNKQRFLDYINR